MTALAIFLASAGGTLLGHVLGKFDWAPIIWRFQCGHCYRFVLRWKKTEASSYSSMCPHCQVWRP